MVLVCWPGLGLTDQSVLARLARLATSNCLAAQYLGPAACTQRFFRSWLRFPSVLYILIKKRNMEAAVWEAIK